MEIWRLATCGHGMHRSSAWKRCQCMDRVERSLTSAPRADCRQSDDVIPSSSWSLYGRSSGLTWVSASELADKMFSIPAATWLSLPARHLPPLHSRTRQHATDTAVSYTNEFTKHTSQHKDYQTVLSFRKRLTAYTAGSRHQGGHFEHSLNYLI